MKNKDTNLLCGSFYALIFTIPVISSLIGLYLVIIDKFFLGANISLHLGVIVFLMLTGAALPLLAFILDRRTLKWEGAFCPHWGWGFFLPVYMWKRVVRNGIPVWWFWLYIFLNFGYTEIVISLMPD